MVQLAKLGVEASQKSDIPVNYDTGAVDMFRTLAAVGGGIADRIGQLAAVEARKKEQIDAIQAEQAGYRDASSLPLANVGAGAGVDDGRGNGARRTYVRDRLVAKGWTAEQAAGVTGAFVQESGLNTGIVGDAGISFGLGQWNRERRAALTAFAAAAGKPVTDIDTQIDFFDHEIRNSPAEQRALLALTSAKTVDDAAVAMMHYERPRDYSPDNPTAGHGWSNRLAYAKNIYGAGSAPSASGGATGQAPVPAVPQTSVPSQGPRFEFRTGYTPADMAYNDAARKTIGARLGVQHQSAMDNIYAANKGDPAKLDQALKGYSQDALAGVTDPQLKAAMTIDLEQAQSAYHKSALGEAEAAAKERVANEKSIFLDNMATANIKTGAALSEQYKGDPTGLASAYDKHMADTLKGIPDPVARADMERQLTADRQQAIAQATREQDAKATSDRRASFEATVEARKAAIVRASQDAGNSASADQALAQHLGALKDQLDRAGDAYTPEEKGKIFHGVVDDMIAARIVGGFNANKTPAGKQAYRDAFVKSWMGQDEVIGQMSPDGYGKIVSILDEALIKDEAERTRQAKAVDTTISSAFSNLEKGYPLTPDAMASVKAQVATLADPSLDARFGFLDSMSTWARAAAASPPQALAAQIDDWSRAIQTRGATPEDIQKLDIAQSLQKTMSEGLKTNALGWASRVGLINPTPIDTSSTETLAVSLQKRVAEADTVGSIYGMRDPVGLLQPGEAQAIGDYLTSNPDQLPAFSRSVYGALGQNTGRFFGEMAKDGPMLAHVAGLTAETGDERVARDVGDMLKRRAVPGYKAPEIPKAKASAAISNTMGTATLLLPRLSAAARETADTLLEGRALRQGFADDDAATAAATEAAQRSLGARMVGDVQYGGAQEVNGLSTLLPPTVSGEEAQQALDMLRPSDLPALANLSSLPAIGSANRYAITPDDIADGHLVAIDTDGHYRVALGDPTSDAPRWVAAADGSPWILDLKAVIAAQNRVSGEAEKRRREGVAERWGMPANGGR
ncbi:MAG: hypothetical protein H6Q99_324 [Proteobacteria bacterium]|nr:hypothetical protein [Pseudomonadota bacterium]